MTSDQREKKPLSCGTAQNISHLRLRYPLGTWNTRVSRRFGRIRELPLLLASRLQGQDPPSLGWTYYDSLGPASDDAMSRSFNKEKPTPAEDLSLALYGLVLDSVLMCWDALEVVNSPTYRGVPERLDLEEGAKIMFTDFLTTSMDRVTGKSFMGLDGTLLKFDNTADTSYCPKSISKFSSSTEDKECVYPIGAEFKVTRVNDSHAYRIVHLELLPKED